MKFYLIDTATNQAVIEDDFGIALFPNCVKVGNQEYEQYNVYNSEVLYCEAVVDFKVGKYQKVNSQLELNPNYIETVLTNDELLILRDDFCDKIDEAIDAVWAKHNKFFAIDNFAFERVKEYVNSNYQSGVPSFVGRYAFILNKTNEEAANLLLNELSLQNSMLNNLMSLRLSKHEIKLKTSIEDMRSVFNNFLGQLGFVENNNAP